jgi:hypothetical protein
MGTAETIIRGYNHIPRIQSSRNDRQGRIGAEWLKRWVKERNQGAFPQQNEPFSPSENSGVTGCAAKK